MMRVFLYPAAVDALAAVAAAVDELLALSAVSLLYDENIEQ